jgi:hypothetical protein
VLERQSDAHARGAKIQAIVVTDRQAFARDGECIHSIAGEKLPGAVHIECWIGLCLAALGAAALAAAIGAARGFPMPVVDPTDERKTLVRTMRLSTSDACIRVSAASDGRRLTVDFTVPVNA